MASQETMLVVSMMKSSHVTANEALAFMGQALTLMEQKKRGTAISFIKELIERRESRTMPDQSGYIS